MFRLSETKLWLFEVDFFGKSIKVIVYKHFAQRGPINFGQKTTGHDSTVENENFDHW